MYLEKQLKPYELGAAQVRLLHLIYSHEGITQIDIAHRLNIDKGTITRSIKKLEQAGLIIKRERLRKDNRIYLLIITDAGLSMKDYVYTALRKWTKVYEIWTKMNR
mgnify:CR=1 FL=1